jgi:heptosyltransferase-3
MALLPDAVPLGEVRRALVVKLRHHGDVLLSSPVFSVLKKRAPALEIDALVYADTAPMLALHPALTELHTIGRNWRSLGTLGRIGNEWRLFRCLAARRYDLLLHLSESWRGAWLARALRPRWSVAPLRRGASPRWHASFTHLVPAPLASGRHVVESNLDALRRIGIQPAPNERELVLEPGEDARRRIGTLLAAGGLQPGRFIHVHPTSRWQFKGWTTAGWVAIIDRLQAGGWRVALTAAPDAAERQTAAEVQRRLARPALDLSGQLSLKELAALAGEARLFIGVDSAPMHIAAAMRTPAVALFGPSGADLWGPWGTPRRGRHQVVASTRHGCRPCGLDGCGGGKVSDCLETLEADRVWQAVSGELQETP